MKVENHSFRLSFSSKFSSFPKMQRVFLCVVIWVSCFSLSQVGKHHSKHSWILMFCGEIWSYSDRHGIICELGLTWRCVCFNIFWSCLVVNVYAVVVEGASVADSWKCPTIKHFPMLLTEDYSLLFLWFLFLILSQHSIL